MPKRKFRSHADHRIEIIAKNGCVYSETFYDTDDAFECFRWFVTEFINSSYVAEVSHYVCGVLYRKFIIR